MISHSPGPWRLSRGDSDDALNPANCHSVSGGWENLALVVTRMNGEPNYDDVGLANARLIAAAPELLEALKYLLEQTVDQDLAYGIVLSEGELSALEKALAAIAKATGCQTGVEKPTPSKTHRCLDESAAKDI